MHTENLHRTLSPQAYASLLDNLRHQAEEERRLAIQAWFPAWPRQMLQRVQHALQALTQTHPLKA